MAGIYGVLLNGLNNERNLNLHKNFYSYRFKNTINQELKYKQNYFGRSVLDKFQNDRFLYENDNYIVCFEGINYNEVHSPEYFISTYEKKGLEFIKGLDGVFSGFLLSKKENKIHIFNDFLGTKRIYYYYNPKIGLAFSSEMHVLSKFLRDNNLSISYDLDGIYSLALYGQMFDDFTLVKEIKTLEYAGILSFDLNTKKLAKQKYYKFEKNIKSQKSPDVIENVNNLMENAVKKEWQKDLDYGYEEHLALISGGMDSRVNALLAKNLGFRKINGYTYANPNSSDAKIAQEIAGDHFYSHLQYNMNNGSFFAKRILEDYIKPTDGLTHFTANAIIYNALLRINRQKYGLVHSGQLGDTVSGSFLKPNFDFKTNSDKIGLTGFVKNKKHLEKIQSLENITKRYQGSDYEVFTYEQRQVNGTLSGDRTVSNFIDQASPFYDKDLVNYILTLPNEFKSNQILYFNWLIKKHPDLLKYKWERIGMKPNSSFNLKYGKLIKKYMNGGKKYFNLKYDSMNPIGNWFKESPEILKTFDAIFNEHIELILDEELKSDLKEIYYDNIFEYRNKFAVITVLLAIKLHFKI